MYGHRAGSEWNVLTPALERLLGGNGDSGEDVMLGAVNPTLGNQRTGLQGMDVVVQFVNELINEFLRNLVHPLSGRRSADLTIDQTHSDRRAHLD